MSKDNPKVKLNEAIKDALEEKHLLQKEYAKQIQVSESAFSNYVTGLREMPYGVLSQVADDFDLDLNYIFKNKAKKMVALDNDEVQFYKTLRSLAEEDRKEIYHGLLLMITAKTVR